MEQVLIRPLINQKGINQALKLLYRVYCIEMQWNPTANNPSEYQIFYQNDEAVLTDKYEQISQWYGIFNDDQQIGCFRLLSPINDFYELESYTTISDLPKSGVEVGRFAVESKSRVLKQIALFRLFEFIINEKVAKGIAWVTATHLTTLQRIYEQLGFMHHGEFFYHHTDEKPAKVYSLAAKTPSVSQKFNAYHERIKRLNKSI